MPADPLTAPVYPCHALTGAPPNSPASVRSFGHDRFYFNIAAGNRRPEVYLHLMSQAWEAGQDDVAGCIYRLATSVLGVTERIGSHCWEQAVANCLFHQCRFGDAGLHYHRAIKDDPKCHRCLFNLGNCHLALGELSEAVDCYGVALELGGDLDPALLNLGVAYLLLGREEHVHNRQTSRAWAARAVKRFQSIGSSDLKLMAQFNELLTLVESNLKIDQPSEVMDLYKHLIANIGEVVTEADIDKIDIVEHRRASTAIYVRRGRLRRSPD